MVNDDGPEGENPRQGQNLPKFLENRMSKRTPPKFTGKDSDWKDFSRDWLRYLGHVRKVAGNGNVNEYIALQLLFDSLDRASQDKLDAARDLDPELTYSSFWGALSQEYDRDMTDEFRDEWQRVTLRHVQKLTVSAWREYQAAFEKALFRATDVSEREAERKLESELPPSLRHSLKMEVLWRQTSEFYVRVPSPPHVHVSLGLFEPN